MAAPTRQVMRHLSPRFQYLTRKPSPIAQQIRHAGRYSNSTPKRAIATVSPDFTLNLSGGVGPQTDRNPLDANAARKAWLEKRAFHMRRMRFAGMGLLLTMGGLMMLIFNLDLDSMDEAEKKRRGQQLDASSDVNAEFQGKEVHVIGAGGTKRIVASRDGQEIELVETGTSSVPHFPRTIYLPPSSDSAAATAVPGVVSTSQPNTRGNPGNVSNQEEYTLIGLGIRTVMWIQVYVVGMYIRTQDISTLQEKLVHLTNPTASALIPGEKADLKKRLLDPDESREIWSKVLQVPGIKTAFRISPTRNTDFGHLRDGFVSGINNRTAEARKIANGAETEYDSEAFGGAIAQLKSIFTGGKAPKGSILLLLRNSDGAMEVLYQPKPGKKEKEMESLGSVADERVSRLLWFGYLAGGKVSSQAAREGVVDGCMEFVERPVGSVETMVH